MVLIAPEGLVGKVLESGATFSKAQSILDSRSSVPAMSVRTGDLGVVKGLSCLLYTSGQKIAESGAFMSSPIFASVSGEVVDIRPMLVPGGAMVKAIVVKNDGKMEEIEGLN